MSFKYKFTLNIGYPGEHTEVQEYDAEPSEEDLERDWKEWAGNYIDGSYHKL